MGWSEIELWRSEAGSWRRYRYSDQRYPTGRPARIEVHTRRGWARCPNVDVSDSIMKLAGLGR
jgi:hypothetical protein